MGGHSRPARAFRGAVEIDRAGQGLARKTSSGELKIGATGPGTGAGHFLNAQRLRLG